jgi:hypothetical protein
MFEVYFMMEKVLLVGAMGFFTKGVPRGWKHTEARVVPLNLSFPLRLSV